VSLDILAGQRVQVPVAAGDKPETASQAGIADEQDLNFLSNWAIGCTQTVIFRLSLTYR